MFSKLIWNSNNTPVELHSMLRALGEEYPVSESGKGRLARFSKINSSDSCFSVSTSNKTVEIKYSTISAAARGISYALMGQSKEEQSSLRTLGIMLDCSRNFVMKVECIKKWLRRLALNGYNFLMLYTEDTYPLEGEPFFGYLRGGYTLDEIRAIDDYAYKLGIEVTACIQTLGHLRQFLKWIPSRKYRDTPSVLLADSDETYALIEKMLLFWHGALRSRRIHIGMDETHDLGLGRHRDIHGYEEPSQIFNRHLNRVNALCQKMGLKPMIWSDMFFRLANEDHGYYHPETHIPDDIVKTIPPNVQLCYWDYYHADEDMYMNMLQAHRRIGFEPIMASGIHTWGGLWWNAEADKQTNPACINVCKKLGIKEIIFTLWGDDGAYCEFDSALNGIFYSGDLAYGENNRNMTGQRLHALCKSNFEAQWKIGHLCPPLEGKDGKKFYIIAQQLLWDDPLLGIAFDVHVRKDESFVKQALGYYKTLHKCISENLRENGAGSMKHALNIVTAILKKIELRRDLESAYDRKDNAALRRIASKNIPETLKAIRAFDDTFRAQWLAKAKPFGLEHIQARNARVMARLKETARRIKELLSGNIASIEELDGRLPASAPASCCEGACRTYMSSSLEEVN